MSTQLLMHGWLEKARRARLYERSDLGVIKLFLDPSCEALFQQAVRQLLLAGIQWLDQVPRNEMRIGTSNVRIESGMRAGGEKRRRQRKHQYHRRSSC